MLLAKLALIYWRPDFTPGQAKQLYSQYLDDLRPFSFADIAEAIEKYRQDPESKFYPTPGQIRGLIETVPSWDVVSKSKHIAERREAGRLEMQKMIANSPGYKAALAANNVVQLAASPQASEGGGS